MKHASLFNGIGGFQLAASMMNWENVFSCEIDEFCNRVTEYHYPECEQYGDIRKTDFRKYRGQIDILTGGFPCQSFSTAGKRLGTKDDRYLWPEMFRTIQEIQPRWVVAENVLGLVNWNGGMVFEQVHADLEIAGYEVQSFILPAAGVNAPHRRYRTWFVAYSKSEQSKQLQFKQSKISKQKQREYRRVCSKNSYKEVFQNWQNFPTQSPVCSRDDGLSSKLDGITLPKWRRESIKAYGNAIVPQVALQIFKAIEMYNLI